MTAPDHPDASAVSAWWGTAITYIEPGVIEHRGVPVADLIGRTGFAEMIWFMVTGERCEPPRARLLEAALVAATDHGPQAPSIAVARMAATCGVGLNNAMASAVNTLGDVHGGAGEQCLALYDALLARADAGDDLAAAAREVVAEVRSQGRYVPGFGHRFHPRDPRRDPLLALVEQARDDGTVPGRHLAAALAIEDALAEGRARPVPMNIDGATAVIYGELGCPPPLARGLFVLSRSVGILAHAWEESQSGRRNKGPMPPSILPARLSPDA
ncbi:citrate synthase [Mumia flava]|uniref:citrate synthase (unknown stereospecificity) n=1 Tax=Mumia flava TaxID=1348852 RepID=A0A0B2BUW4_9ACTN|nr:citryl-CoA lyase [Mumia flava]PJJ58034.1 citrate synthase [Mumia flava]